MSSEEPDEKEKLEQENNESPKFVSGPNVVKVVRIEHKNGKSQVATQHSDLFDYARENRISDDFCKKDKESGIQMKFSCLPCRTILESVLALKSHLVGTKHVKNVSEPYEVAEFSFQNGKCKWKNKKREAEEYPTEQKLSKRQRTKNNKIARSIPILPQHTDAKYDETETYFENNLRKVKPYYFTFSTHAKGRWIGMKICDVFAREFRAMTPEEYNRNIKLGLVKINGEKTSADYRICNNDFLSHVVHRHELPVTGEPIKIVYQDNDWVVVDKPGSMPVHPCGRYRHNTVLFILAKEHGLRNLHTVHRLDRLTSGVLLFGKTAAKARELDLLIRNQNVSKEYVCRVSGEFPADPLTCDQPIEIVSYKIGVCRVSAAGKPCTTQFQRLKYKDGISIVSCKPKSGRMHQIRVHLQYLGHPIVNDPLYNSDIFGPEKGKNGNIGKSNEELIQDLIKFHTVENWIASDAFKESDFEEFCDDSGVLTKASSVITCDTEEKEFEKLDEKCEEEISKASESLQDISASDKDSILSNETDTIDPNCDECKTKFKDPPASTMVMDLHAFRYSGEGWTFETELPSWAKN